jgi:hypothetical protein
MSLDGLIGKAWEDVTVPGERPAGTMVSEAERQLLYYIASEYFTDSGHIFDTGCFLGGSTLALGYGLQAWQARHGRAPTHRIHAYDLFLVYPWMFLQHLSQDEFKSGDTLLPKFERMIEPIREYVDVHPGDIRTLPHPPGPIEILFIDLAKSPELSDYVVREFFPALIPGRSLVIQQDYMYHFAEAGWLHVTMEFYAPYFRKLTDTTENSVAWLYETEIPATVLRQHTLASLSAAEKIALLAKARTRFEGLQADIMARAHRQYVLSKQFAGEDVPGHEAVRAMAAYFLERPGAESELVAAPATNDRLDAEPTAAVADNDGLGRELATAVAENHRLRRELARSQERLRSMRLWATQMENSLSWRLTKGLRWVRRALLNRAAKRQQT